jgi:hypothetical protein
MQKKQLMLSISLVSIIVAFVCYAIIYLIKFAEPQITIKASINSITQDDYKIITKRSDIDFSQYGIDKFKHIDISFEFKQPIFIIRNRNVDATFTKDLDSIFINNVGVMMLSGGGLTQDNESELKAIYQRNKEVLLNNISVNELEGLFDGMKVKVKWNKALKGEEERVYYIKDYLQIVN